MCDTRYFQRAVREWLKEAGDEMFATAIIDVRGLPASALSEIAQRAQKLKAADEARTHALGRMGE